MIARTAAALLITTLAAVPIEVALAQSDGDRLRQGYDSALQAMQNDLANPERSFEFVQAATDVGDYRGAIAALERILLINPNLANIKLELGVLYLRVGSPDLAVNHINEALAAPNVPEIVRVRAEELLSTAQAQVRSWSITGSVFVGGRFDTNANTAPGSGLVQTPFGPATLSNEATKQPDWSAVTTLSTRFVYDFGNQSSDTLEANLLGYLSRYREQHQVNLALIDLDVGPRFHIGTDATPTLSVRPYARLGYINLGDRNYLSSYGAGVGVRKLIGGDLSIELDANYAHRPHYNSDLRPFNSDRTGDLLSTRLDLIYQVSPTTALTVRGQLGRNIARRGYESYWDWALAAGIIQSYDAPFGVTLRPWTTALDLQVRRTEYDDGDPFVDPANPRDERRYDVFLTTEVPVTERLSAVLVLQRTVNEANLVNYRFNNSSVMAGVQYRF